MSIRLRSTTWPTIWARRGTCRNRSPKESSSSSLPTGSISPNRKLKPLAIQVAERKKNAKTQTKSAPARRAGTRPKTPNGQPEVKLSKEQQTKVAALKKEFGQRRAELQKQLDDLLTDDQKQARDAAKKKALAEGKGGVKLRTAMDAALNLTPAQQKKFNELREAIGQLTREHRQKLDEFLRNGGNVTPEDGKTRNWTRAPSNVSEERRRCVRKTCHAAPLCRGKNPCNSRPQHGHPRRSVPLHRCSKGITTGNHANTFG